MIETLTIRVPCGTCGRLVESIVTHRRYMPPRLIPGGVPVVKTTFTEAMHPCRPKPSPQEMK